MSLVLSKYTIQIWINKTNKNYSGHMHAAYVTLLWGFPIELFLGIFLQMLT